MFDGSEIQFPSREFLQKGWWAPVHFMPHPDSPELFVVGVISWNNSEFCSLSADSSKRIRCVFENSADTVMLAQRSAMQALQRHMETAGTDHLAEFKFGFSGISLGPVRAGEAKDAEALARYWLNRISSLHQSSPEILVDDEELATSEEMTSSQISNDRLPVLVYNEVEKHTPHLANFFSNEIRSRARRLPKPAPQKVFVGFAGDGVVANFATLRPTRSRVMVDHIKRLMWDLARTRDDEIDLLPVERKFEMFVYRRPADDPELTSSQDKQLNEMIEDLGEQGAKEEIGVLTRHSVGGIASYIASRERAIGRFSDP